jgi:hypothetical protein
MKKCNRKCNRNCNRKCDRKCNRKCHRKCNRNSNKITENLGIEIYEKLEIFWGTNRCQLSSCQFVFTNEGK